MHHSPFQKPDCVNREMTPWYYLCYVFANESSNRVFKQCTFDTVVMKIAVCVPLQRGVPGTAVRPTPPPPSPKLAGTGGSLQVSLHDSHGKSSAINNMDYSY